MHVQDIQKHLSCPACLLVAACRRLLYVTLPGIAMLEPECSTAALVNVAENAQVREKIVVYGGVLDPHACFLLQRGLTTLALRVRQQISSALALAKFLEEQPQVTAYQIVACQMPIMPASLFCIILPLVRASELISVARAAQFIRANPAS